MHPDFYTALPTYRRVVEKLRELKRQFPFLQVRPLGKSVLGRTLYGAQLGTASPCILMAGAFHAQEWLTASLLLRFLEELCVHLREEISLPAAPTEESLRDRGLVILPMVNPDGVSIALEGPESAGALAPAVRKLAARESRSWQANAHGVDLNHNFDAGWSVLHKLEQEQGIHGPGPRQYGGPFPHSEPESRALVEFLRERRVEAVYAFHSQGEEIFSEYGTHTPPRSRPLARLLAEASGYTLVENDGLYSHGGFKDYFIERYHRPGFTVEIGRGENPLPVSALPGIYARLKPMLLLASVM